MAAADNEPREPSPPRACCKPENIQPLDDKLLIFCCIECGRQEAYWEEAERTSR